MHLPATIRTAGRALDRLVRGATVERLGGGLLVGGLVWGFLKLVVSNFPTAPLVVATLGAFLLAAGLTGNLVSRFAPEPTAAAAPIDPRAEDRDRLLRQQLLLVQGELESIAHLAGGPLSPWDWQLLPDDEWRRSRDYLAGVAGFAETYSTINGAYIAADQADRVAKRATDMERDFEEHELSLIAIAEDCASRAIRAIQAHLVALEAGA